MCLCSKCDNISNPDNEFMRSLDLVALDAYNLRSLYFCKVCKLFWHEDVEGRFNSEITITKVDFDFIWNNWKSNKKVISFAEREYAREIILNKLTFYKKLNQYIDKLEELIDYTISISYSKGGSRYDFSSFADAIIDEGVLLGSDSNVDE